MTKAKVYVLYTGGTFGMVPDASLPGTPLTPVPLDEISPRLPRPDQLPNCTNVNVKLDELSRGRRIDSSSMTPDDWIDIATLIRKNYDDHDGFVVIQGTDTLSYTASALSFMFRNLDKPIVVTGSQLPLSEERTDARLNYCHALMIAGYKSTGLPRIPEVIVVFADKVMRGCRVRKMSASAWAGFDSPNAPLLGEIGEHIRIFEGQIRPRPPRGSNLQLDAALETNVLDLSLYPGIQPQHLRSILSLRNVRGVILRTFGSGNAPEDPEFIGALRDGIKKDNKTIVNITQCPQGEVEMGLYAASVGLMDLGVLSGSDMTPEAALTKLMVLMGSRLPEDVRRQMQIDQRGEQSHSLFNLDLPHTEPGSWVTRLHRDDNLHGQFKPHTLKAAVLRISALEIENRTSGEPAMIGVYLNLPRAVITGRSRPIDPRKLIYRVDLDPVEGKRHPRDIAQALPIEEVKNNIQEEGNSLTVFSHRAGRFRFRKLSLTLITQP